jgi:hypothetical protein
VHGKSTHAQTTRIDIQKRPTEAPGNSTNLEEVSNGVSVDLAPLRLDLSMVADLLLLEELGLLVVNALLAGEDIGGLGRGVLGLHDELVPNNHDDVKWDTQVRGDEGRVIEVTEEDVECLEEGDQAAKSNGDVGSNDTEWSNVGEGTVWDTLCLTSLDEVDVANQDGDPGQETEDGDQVHEVSEDGVRCRADTQVGQETEGSGDPESVDGDTTLVGASKEARSFAFSGKTEECSGSNVEILKEIGC